MVDEKVGDVAADLVELMVYFDEVEVVDDEVDELEVELFDETEKVDEIDDGELDDDEGGIVQPELTDEQIVLEVEVIDIILIYLELLLGIDDDELGQQQTLKLYELLDADDDDSQEIITASEIDIMQHIIDDEDDELL